MATQILDESNCIKVVIDGTVRHTFPKRRIVLHVDGDTVDIINDGEYSTEVLYTDVSNPASSSAENLRSNIALILNA